MSNTTPIFKTVFGKHWDLLPPVLKHHYANRPFCEDANLAKGSLKIQFNGIARLLTPMFRLFGVLVPYQGNAVPVTVWFKSELNSNAFRFERKFHFPNRSAYTFASRLVPLKNEVLVEYVKHGIGWKHRCYFDSRKVILEHLGYVWTIAGRTFPVPLTWVLGKGYAEEIPLTAQSFAMLVQLTHPLFGKLYEYRGQFEMRDE
ncbi:MAG: DUF4166 domain-containing protein [Gammaproteobacteria bacterium]|jgi:hypothetical protein